MHSEALAVFGSTCLVFSLHRTMNSRRRWPWWEREWRSLSPLMRARLISFPVLVVVWALLFCILRALVLVQGLTK